MKQPIFNRTTANFATQIFMFTSLNLVAFASLGSAFSQTIEAAVTACASHKDANSIMSCAYPKLPKGSASTCKAGVLQQNMAWCLEKRNGARRNGQADLISAWRRNDPHGIRRNYLYCQVHQLKRALNDTNPFVVGVNCPASKFGEVTTAASKACPPCW